jgi:hypothetical protein
VTDMPDIPDFLRVENRAQLRALPLPQWFVDALKRPRVGRRARHDLPRSVEPAGLKLLKEIERERDEKQKARFAVLKERREIERKQARRA